MAHEGRNIPTAPWHAPACKPVVRNQAALAPCIRHLLTPPSAQLRSLKKRSQLRRFSFVLTIATIGRPATLKMHS
jgi:hypothetical protein